MTHYDNLDARLAVSPVVYQQSGIKVQCKEPSHQDDSASCVVYQHGIVCYGCGLTIRGSIPAIRYLVGDDADLSKYRAENAIQGHPTVGGSGPSEQTRRIDQGDVEMYQRILWGVRKPRLQWLYERGLNDATIQEAQLGHTGDRFTIPVYGADGSLLNIRSRRDDVFGTEYREGRHIPKYKGVKGYNGPHLFMAHTLTTATRSSVWIVEGELDALLLYQHGYTAVSMTNGAGRMKEIPPLLHPFQRITHLYVVGDQDEIGRQHAEECAEVALNLNYEVTRVRWPVEHGKDITDYLKGHSLRGATYETKTRLPTTRRKHPTHVARDMCDREDHASLPGHRTWQTGGVYPGLQSVC